jgi:predicted dehydrogenase
VRNGRIGEITRAWVAIGGGDVGGPFKKLMCPAELNYEMWLGQAPLNDYIPERVYYTFRWWYDYSGGKLTDWGAHHVDAAQWISGNDNTSPVTIEPLMVEHPVPFKDGYPLVDNAFNTAVKFQLNCKFANGFEMRVQDSVNEPGLADFGNGVLFEGTNGRLFVNRERVSGAAVEELAAKPLPEDAMRQAYKGHEPTDHMKNFFDCVQSRDEPISDVFSHHRILTTCHLSNIALRLNKAVNWDPETEQVVGDEQAASFVSRPQREAYKIVV